MAYTEDQDIKEMSYLDDKVEQHMKKMKYYIDTKDLFKRELLKPYLVTSGNLAESI